VGEGGAVRPLGRVIAQAGATIDPAGRVTRLTGRPPLTLRQVRAGSGEPTTLCLVGAAAGPLGGDDLQLRLDIESGSAARLVSTGATLAQGRGDGRAPGRLRTSVTVGAGGTLLASPPPLVACAGSRTEVTVELGLDTTASLDWCDLLVLGRSGEPAGAVRLDWDVRRGGVPLLRQCVDLTDPVASRWSGLLAGHRVLATELIVVGGELAGRPPYLAGLVPQTVVLSPTAVAQQLDEDSVLLTVLAAAAAVATKTLEDLRTRLTSPPNDRLGLRSAQVQARPSGGASSART
jgi:urease accessory protein